MEAHGSHEEQRFVYLLGVVNVHEKIHRMQLHAEEEEELVEDLFEDWKLDLLRLLRFMDTNFKSVRKESMEAYPMLVRMAKYIGLQDSLTLKHIYAIDWQIQTLVYDTRSLFIYGHLLCRKRNSARDQGAKFRDLPVNLLGLIYAKTWEPSCLYSK